MTEVLPKAITADRNQGILIITWADGHVSDYSFELLRAACPCAGCRGGHENMRPEPDEEVFSSRLPNGPEIHMRSIEGVGSYAITIEWEDGHHYGIYNWHYLRKLCPCQECRKKTE